MTPYYQSTVDVCRAALQRGHLTKITPTEWKFGRRTFGSWTVNRLIDAGEAIRIGDHIVAWRPQ